MGRLVSKAGSYVMVHAYVNIPRSATTTSTETYEIMTRSICHTSMPSLPCYVCEFGLPTGAHLMTVSTVSKRLVAGPMQWKACTDREIDVEYGVPRSHACRHCPGMLDLRDVRGQDFGSRIHPGREVLWLPAVRYRRSRCQHDPGEPPARDGISGWGVLAARSGWRRRSRRSRCLDRIGKHAVAPAVYVAHVPYCGSVPEHCAGRIDWARCRTTPGYVIANAKVSFSRKLIWSSLDGGPIGVFWFEHELSISQPSSNTGAHFSSHCPFSKTSCIKPSFSYHLLTKQQHHLTGREVTRLSRGCWVVGYVTRKHPNQFRPTSFSLSH